MKFGDLTYEEIKGYAEAGALAVGLFESIWDTEGAVKRHRRSPEGKCRMSTVTDGGTAETSAFRLVQKSGAG